MRTLIIGDIHGCLETLKALIDKAGPVDKIISCGDLIDRGPSSIETVKFIRENNIQVTLGNHELMFIDAMSDFLGPDHPYKRMGLLTSDWYANGGKQVFKSFSSTEEMQDMVDYFKTLPIYIELNHEVNNLPVVISHTCLNAFAYDILNASNEELWKHPTSFVWSRSQAPKGATFFNIYGHTPTDYLGISGAKPLVATTGLNLDTGCCYDTKDRGVLTAVLLPDYGNFEIIQQEFIG